MLIFPVKLSLSPVRAACSAAKWLALTRRPGAKVAALDLNEEAVQKLADELTAEGYICKGYKANVLDPEALEAVHQQVLADLGPCDILVNGAGGNNPRATTDNEYQHEAKEGQKTFFDLDQSGVDFVFKLNFQARCCRLRRLPRTWSPARAATS